MGIESCNSIFFRTPYLNKKLGVLNDFDSLMFSFSIEYILSSSIWSVLLSIALDGSTVYAFKRHLHIIKVNNRQVIFCIIKLIWMQNYF